MGFGGAWANRIVVLLPVILLGVLAVALGTVAVAAGIVTVAAVGLAGTVMGVWVGAVNFGRVLGMANKDARRVAAAAPPAPRWYDRHPQPAFLMYPYRRVWYASRYVLRHVWHNTRNDATRWFQRGSASLSHADRRPIGGVLDIPVKIGEYGWGAGLYLGGVFLFAAAMLLVTLVTVGMLLYAIAAVIFTSLLVLVLGLFNRIYATYYRITIRCPNCHSEMPIPVYVCDRCGTHHDRLWPSIYGVRYHECKGEYMGGVCGNRLPTADWWGRKQLDQLCPTCGHTLAEGIGRETNVHIPIVGGPAAGKTNFLVAATYELMHTYGPQHGLDVTLPAQRDADSLARSIAILKQGRPIEKTSAAEDSAPAYTMEIRRRSGRVPSLVYLYDAAGEYYTEEDRALRQVYFRYVQGVVFIIDPFSIEMVRAIYADRLAAAPAFQPSSENLESVYERMVRVMEASHGPHPGRRFPQPVAVVVTKVDAFDLERYIGMPAARELLRRDPHLRLEEDAISILVERFLVQYGAYNFVSSLHGQFSTVKFFSSSALGYDPNSSFSPVRALQPLLWIMGEVGALPVRRQRARSVDQFDREQGRQQRRGLRHYLWNSLEPVQISPTVQERQR